VNYNRPLHPGRIDPNNFEPYPKTPTLARFFVNIGFADTLGSGVRNLHRYTKIYSGKEPELIEGDIFQTIIPLSKAQNAPANAPVNAPANIPLNSTAKALLQHLTSNPALTFDECADVLAVCRLADGRGECLCWFCFSRSFFVYARNGDAVGGGV
jgi:predicted HTH transcriptional regulator